MTLQRRISVVVMASGLVLLGACGSSGDDDAASDVAPSGSTAADAASGDHGDMDHGAGGHEDMDHGGAPTGDKPLALLPDGTIDPDKVDLSGVEGVSAEEQARAEDLLQRTIRELPRWSDPEVAIADGFKSIGDGLTGEEHLIRWDWIDDDVMFDPTQPESLVYSTRGETPVLEAAMFILPKQYTLENLPNVGGKLTQFHIHDDLCFSRGDAPQVLGFTDPEGNCPESLQKFNPNAMLHVWIRPNECGPFAALLGAGAGQIPEGEERACDHQHGRLSL